MGEEGKKGKRSASAPQENLSNWSPEGDFRSAEREMFGRGVECMAAASSLVRWGGAATLLGACPPRLLGDFYRPLFIQVPVSMKFSGVVRARLR